MAAGAFGGRPASASLEMGGTSRLVQAPGYLVNPLRSQCLLADQLVLHLPTFVRSLNLSLELLAVLRICAGIQHRYPDYGCNEPSRPRKDPGRLRSDEVPPHSADEAQDHHSGGRLRLAKSKRPPGSAWVAVSVFKCFWTMLAVLERRLWLVWGWSLSGFRVVLQSSLLDGVAFDPFSFQEDGPVSAEVDVGGRQVL